MGVQFQYSEYAWMLLLLLIPMLFWFWWEQRKRAIIKKMAHPAHLLQTLLKNYHPAKNRLRFISYAIAFAGIVLAIMNPRKVQEKANTPMEGAQVMLAMDVSNSMLATDVAPNRLEKARTFAVKLIELIGGNRIGVVAFAGEAILQMPPSGDLSAVKQAIQTLSTKSIPVQGTNIEEALSVTQQSLSANALAYSAVVLITDGEELEGGALEAARKFGRQGMVVYVVGVGTEKGSFLTEPDSGQPFKNENDEQVFSKANFDLFTKLAEVSGGEYVQLTDIDKTVSELASNLNNLESRALPNTNLVNYYSFAPWILIGVLLLLLWEWLPVKWLSFPPKKLKGVTVLSIVLLFLCPHPVWAQKATAMLKQAEEAYKAGNWEQATAAYENALGLEPGNQEALFYRALVAFKSGRFEDAARQFNEIAAIKPGHEIYSAALNNAGLAFAEAKKLPEAIAAFKQALKEKPGDANVRQNLQKAIMEQMAQNEKPPQNEEKQKPPMDKEEADKKLQSLMDDERRTREKMKPRPLGTGNSKNW